MAKLSELKAQAESLAREGRHEQALKIYDHVLQHIEGTAAIEREFPLHVEAGDALAALDRGDEAVKHYRAAAKRYAKQGSAANIIELSAKIQAADPSQRTVYFALAGAILDNGHVEAAREVLADFAERTGRQKMHQGLSQLAGRTPEKVTVVLRKAIDTGLGRPATGPTPAVRADPTRPAEPVEEPTAEPAMAGDESETAEPEEETPRVTDGLVVFSGGSEADDAIEAEELAVPEEPAAEEAVPPPASPPPVPPSPPTPPPQPPAPSLTGIPDEPPAGRLSEGRPPAPWERSEPRVLVREEDEQSALRKWMWPAIGGGVGIAIILIVVVSLTGGEDGGIPTGQSPAIQAAAPGQAVPPLVALPDSDSTALEGSVGAAGDPLATIGGPGNEEDTTAQDSASLGTPPPIDTGAAPPQVPPDTATDTTEVVTAPDTTTAAVPPPRPPPPAIPEVNPPDPGPGAGTPPVSPVEIVVIQGLGVDRAEATGTGWEVVQTLETGETLTLTLESGTPNAPDQVVGVRLDPGGDAVGEADHSGYRVTVRGAVSQDVMRGLLARLVAQARP